MNEIAAKLEPSVLARSPHSAATPSRHSTLRLPALLALCFAILFVSSIPLADASGPSRAFGNRVAGSYLVENLTIPEAGLQDVQALATLTADGSAVATDSDDFGLAATAPHSPKQGAWKRTGRREIAITVLEFAYIEDGTHSFTWLLEFSAEFDDRKFNSGSGELVAKLFPSSVCDGFAPPGPRRGPTIHRYRQFRFSAHRTPVTPASR